MLPVYDSLQKYGTTMTKMSVCKLHMDVYCTCYVPICRANGMEKASFEQIIGAESKS